MPLLSNSSFIEVAISFDFFPSASNDLYNFLAIPLTTLLSIAFKLSKSKLTSTGAGIDAVLEASELFMFPFKVSITATTSSVILFLVVSTSCIPSAISGMLLPDISRFL